MRLRFGYDQPWVEEDIMAETLTVYLVNKAGNLEGMFDEARRKACAEALKGYLSAIINGVAAFSGVKVTWDGKAGEPKRRDFVCYLLTTAKESIVARRATEDVTLGPAGSTQYSPADQAVISEVYLRQIVQGGMERGNATPDAEWVVANCILHEIGHALLDAKTPVILDVHALAGGTILRDTDSRPLTERDRPSAVDNTSFQTGLSRPNAGAKPYTGAMPS
jgi:hypothetical protein